MHDERFHCFSDNDLAGATLPQLFTFPFHYTPHPLCVLASNKVQAYLHSRSEWHDELQQGKMMGVLVVKKDDQVGFLAAFSGNLAHSNNHPYFVPAVYDLLSEKGFFRPEEDNISAINRLIDEEMSSTERQALSDKLTASQSEADKEISAYKIFMKQAKAQRDTLRNSGCDIAPLISESQFQKAEFKRLQTRWTQAISLIKNELAERDKKVAEWKSERHLRSAALQERIFRHFIILNARGERKDLCDIFASTPQSAPPAGAGECAAPKLLQYAYLNDYKPLAMAEFWVGNSPKEEIRRHGHFYPSCKAKCEPILNWAMQGLDVEPNPLENAPQESSLDIVFEDDFLLVVNKPEGVLSVPGKLSVDSIQEQVQRLYTEGDKPLIVHRLDMATSGLLIFAKSQTVHKLMQALFASRRVTKRYIAILDGIIEQDNGTISLPLTLNPQERPLQIVSHTHGKPAITRFEVLERKNNTTRIAFYPQTGRTHQLRVHSAHPEGLNTPIIGDTLYGTAAERLYLHAESVIFTHPITQVEIKITTQCPF